MTPEELERPGDEARTHKKSAASWSPLGYNIQKRCLSCDGPPPIDGSATLDRKPPRR